MRLIFMGTPDYAVPTLKALSEAGHEIAAVYCQPPRPAGRRGLETKPSPVHQAALDLGLDVFTPVSLKNADEQARFSAFEADAAIVVAYGLLLPQAILDAPRFGAWNGHASLLPRWRGAAPIQRAIMAGDTSTGVMIMKMDAGLDTGPVALTGEIAISPEMSGGALHDELSELTAQLMVKAVEKLNLGELPTTPQNINGITYASKINKAETHIDFSQTAEKVHNHIRALSPFPGAWFELPVAGKAERVKVLSARLGDADGMVGIPGTFVDDTLQVACATGSIVFERLQKAGGKPLDAPDFLRGTSVASGTVAG